MCPKFVDKSARKNEILTSVMGIIAKKGYAHIKMADIAMEADIGKGTLYEYFDSKEELFTSAFDKFRKDIGTAQTKKLRKVSGAAEKLKALILAWADLLSHTSFDYFELITDFWSEGIRQKQTAIEDRPGILIEQAYREYRMFVENGMDILFDTLLRGIGTSQL